MEFMRRNHIESHLFFWFVPKMEARLRSLATRHYCIWEPDRYRPGLQYVSSAELIAKAPDHDKHAQLAMTATAAHESFL